MMCGGGLPSDLPRPLRPRAGRAAAVARRLRPGAAVRPTPSRGAGSTAPCAALLAPASRRLRGPAPRVEGRPLAPRDAWGHDVLLVAGPHGPHARAARRADDAGLARLVRHQPRRGRRRSSCSRQNALLRRHALGDFRDAPARRHARPGDARLARRDLEHEVGPERELRARAAWSCSRSAPGARYTEADVRELARALTGWRAEWREGRASRLPLRPGVPRPRRARAVFGAQGRATTGATRRDLAVAHRAHADVPRHEAVDSFIPVAPSRSTREGLERLYRREGHAIRPLLGRDPRHPPLYEGPRWSSRPWSTSPACCGRWAAGSTRTPGPGSAPMSGQTLFAAAQRGRLGRHRWIDTGTLARTLDGATTRSRAARWTPTRRDALPDQAAQGPRGGGRRPAHRFWGRPTLSRARPGASSPASPQRAAVTADRGLEARLLRDACARTPCGC